jgi:hypothetical protein
VENSSTVVTTAIARELSEFVWAIAKHVQVVGGGSQPAHQNIINRRFDDCASCPALPRAILNRATHFHACYLKRLEPDVSNPRLNWTPFVGPRDVGFKV